MEDPKLPQKMQKALALRERSQERVHRELNAIMLDHPTILGPDGNPTEGSRDKISNAVLDLINRYLNAPTLMEQGVINLDMFSIEGASLSLMTLITLTVFEPARQVAPSVAPVIPNIFMHLLGFAKQNSPIQADGFDPLVEELSQHINLKAKDEHGVDLVMGEDLDKMKSHVCREVLSGLLSQCVVMGFMSMGDEELAITDKGDRLFRHLIAVNSWIQELQAETNPSSILISQ